MEEEEFIIKFYACDNQEQFLKDVYHNLNCLQQENKHLLELQKSMDKQYEELENRVYKTIGYIENNYDFYYGDELLKDYEDILKILKGENNEG